MQIDDKRRPGNMYVGAREIFNISDNSKSGNDDKSANAEMINEGKD